MITEKWEEVAKNVRDNAEISRSFHDIAVDIKFLNNQVSALKEEVADHKFCNKVLLSILFIFILIASELLYFRSESISRHEGLLKDYLINMYQDVEGIRDDVRELKYPDNFSPEGVWHDDHEDDLWWYED